MRRTRLVPAVALGLLAWSALPAGPALAHGARALVQVSVLAPAVSGPDGADVQVSATVTFVDGDPVPHPDLAAAALGAGGEQPVALHSSGPAGAGPYVGTVHLAPGAWQVVVRSLGSGGDQHEALGSGTGAVLVAAEPVAAPVTPGAAAPSPAPTAAPTAAAAGAAAGPAPARAADSAQASGLPIGLLATAAALLGVVVLGIVVRGGAARRSRARRGPAGR